MFVDSWSVITSCRRNWRTIQLSRHLAMHPRRGRIMRGQPSQPEARQHLSSIANGCCCCCCCTQHASSSTCSSSSLGLSFVSYMTIQSFDANNRTTVAGTHPPPTLCCVARWVGWQRPTNQPCTNHGRRLSAWCQVRACYTSFTTVDPKRELSSSSSRSIGNNRAQKKLEESSL